MRVLLVDDDNSSVEALRQLLEVVGHTVSTAANGQEALDRLHEPEPCCLILLDIMMPVMDGYEFREKQLNDPRLAAIPVIVVTADGRAKEKASQLGVDRFFQKPLSPLELLRTVQKFCPLAE